MIFYLLGLSYFVFLLEGMIKDSHRKFLCFIYPFLICVPLLELLSDNRFFTIFSIILTLFFLIIFYKTILQKRFSLFALTLIVLAFFINESRLFSYYSEISFSLIAISTLILSRNTKIWTFVILGLILIFLPITFDSKQTLYFKPFNYHTVFIPNLIYLTAIAFWAIVLPFLITLLDDKPSLSSIVLIITIPIFCVLNIMDFYSTTSPDQEKLFAVLPLLTVKFRTIVLCFSLLPLFLLIKKMSGFKIFSSILSLQFSFIFFYATLDVVPNNIIQMQVITCSIGIIVFSHLIFYPKEKLHIFTAILLCFSSIFVPINILLNINKITPVNYVQFLFFLALLWKSLEELRLNFFERHNPENKTHEAHLTKA